jgi:hypothetical protein
MNIEEVEKKLATSSTTTTSTTPTDEHGGERRDLSEGQRSRGGQQTCNKHTKCKTTLLSVLLHFLSMWMRLILRNSFMCLKFKHSSITN